MKRKTSSPIFLFVTLFLTACSSPHTLETRVTEDNYRSVSISAVSNQIEQESQQTEEPYRFWFTESLDFLYDESTQSTPLHVDGDRLNILALSGGGANGAFGAGVINALYDNDQLEDYTVVTGISAGALVAPFVFVGGEDIPRLKEVMLGINDTMLLGKQNWLNTLFKDAFTNGESLYGFIESVYTPEMIQKIALKHQSGQRLFVGTTQFDSERLMVWNIGRIAESNLPNKIGLIHQVLAASASIPGVFPPQFIEVIEKNKHYEELHVDGGLATQMFFDIAQTDFTKVSHALGLSTKPQVHVIRNGVFNLPYQAIPDKGISLLSRSLQSMTVRQARGDLYRMMYLSQLSDLDVSFTYMGEDFNGSKATKDMFDLQYMKALYEYGYQKVDPSGPWTTVIP
ncbi:patatin-like phospholipase family protein [Vibrio sp. YMD68]|uniref:patatin-like phospholipase family protein n=1 Tax=Vibrio sp. YMD68 TaxID=3042300 RepID=UPI00249C8FBB|nr:patatin-like phospholipase family protein [Vibrio sp. YMD68]WGV98000.1 patatin-like phospholipase family protein [Vibrio sp. YMD68]